MSDCKMASRATRAFLASQGDFSWCPLPQLQRAEDDLVQSLEAVWSGEHALSPVCREQQDGQPALIAEGYAHVAPMGAGTLQRWTERRLGGRSIRQAQAAERALRARVAKAIAPIEALNQRGRGKKRFEAVST
jgi:hypothetical protein